MGEEKEAKGIEWGMQQVRDRAWHQKVRGVPFRREGRPAHPNRRCSIRSWCSSAATGRAHGATQGAAHAPGDAATQLTAPPDGAQRWVSSPDAGSLCATPSDEAEKRRPDDKHTLVTAPPCSRRARHRTSPLVVSHARRPPALVPAHSGGAPPVPLRLLFPL